jgi:hypothetical protein
MKGMLFPVTFDELILGDQPWAKPGTRGGGGRLWVLERRASRSMRSQRDPAACPANRAINNQGDGVLFDRPEFYYDEQADMFRCPAGQWQSG